MTVAGEGLEMADAALVLGLFELPLETLRNAERLLASME